MSEAEEKSQLEIEMSKSSLQLRPISQRHSQMLIALSTPGVGEPSLDKLIENTLLETELSIEIVEGYMEIERDPKKQADYLLSLQEAALLRQVRLPDDVSLYIIQKSKRILNIIYDSGNKDTLTRINNRQGLAEALRNVLLSRFYQDVKSLREGDTPSNTPLQNNDYYVMIIDADKFKNVNDDHGHPAGDLVLQEIARTLETRLKRTSDIVGRWGGEEFLTIFEAPSYKKAMEFADGIRKDIESLEVGYEGEKIKVTISGGIDRIEHETLDVKSFNEEDLQNLVHRPDKSLYLAKSLGRNLILPYDQSMIGEFGIVAFKINNYEQIVASRGKRGITLACNAIQKYLSELNQEMTKHTPTIDKPAYLHGVVKGDDNKSYILCYVPGNEDEVFKTAEQINERLNHKLIRTRLQMNIAYHNKPSKNIKKNVTEAIDKALEHFYKMDNT